MCLHHVCAPRSYPFPPSPPLPSCGQPFFPLVRLRPRVVGRATARRDLCLSASPGTQLRGTLLRLAGRSRRKTPRHGRIKALGPPDRLSRGTRLACCSGFVRSCYCLSSSSSTGVVVVVLLLLLLYLLLLPGRRRLCSTVAIFPRFSINIGSPYRNCRYPCTGLKLDIIIFL